MTDCWGQFKDGYFMYALAPLQGGEKGIIFGNVMDTVYKLLHVLKARMFYINDDTNAYLVGEKNILKSRF